MKKIVTFVFLLVTCLYAFADSSARVYFPSLASEPVYPLECDLGQTVPQNKTAAHELLAKALKEPYSFDWSEQYLAPQFKKILTTLYSSTLSEILPANDFMFSRANKNADNSVSISVKFMNTDTIISFVILENQIIGINSVKK